MPSRFIETLCDRINRYWYDRGVKANAEPSSISGGIKSQLTGWERDPWPEKGLAKAQEKSRQMKAADTRK